MKLTSLIEWLRQALLTMQSSKWGIFAGCTVLYIICLLIIFRAFKRREDSLEGQLSVACKTMEQIVQEYDIPDLDFVRLSLKACGLDEDPQELMERVKESSEE